MIFEKWQQLQGLSSEGEEMKLMSHILTLY